MRMRSPSCQALMVWKMLMGSSSNQWCTWAGSLHMPQLE